MVLVKVGNPQSFAFEDNLRILCDIAEDNSSNWIYVVVRM